MSHRSLNQGSVSHWGRFHSDGETAARPQDARDLGDRAREVEPVERLGDEHRVDGRVGERDRLGGAGEHADLRELLLELAAHAVERLDRDDIVGVLGQDARELAGSRGEVEHARGAEAVEQGGDGVRRPSRSPVLVVVGLDAPGASRHRVDGHQRRPRAALIRSSRSRSSPSVSSGW